MRVKRLWLCIAATLAMVACIPVDDFGTYWDKGVVDPALEVTWKSIDLPGRPPEERIGPKELRFIRTGSSYSMVGIEPSIAPEVIERLKASDAQASNPQLSVRTLRVGTRRFLMERNPEPRSGGAIVSYEIRGRALTEYWYQSDALIEFLRTRHPGAKNIHKALDVGSVVIGTFDDEVFRILSEVPDLPAYRTLIARYQKASN